MIPLEESLGYFMYERQARTYGGTDETVEYMWNTFPEVREFWVTEALAVIGFIGVDDA